MAGKYKRNVDMHTSATQAESNIVSFLHRVGATAPEECCSLSTLGYQAFPGYDFKAPQGAAFAVSKIVARMEKRGVLRFHLDDWRRGYYLVAAAQPAQQGAGG